MASATRLPLKTLGFTLALCAGVIASRVHITKILIRVFTGPGKHSRILATLLLLANLKNIPLVWHYRVWSSILRHFIFSRPKIPSTLATSALFLPVITSSYSPLWECDYNLHKSNSTYFSDLDVTRSHIICVLFQPAIDKLQRNSKYELVRTPEGKPVSGRWNIMLGAVSCSFKREIGIYQPYEMWSRLLCWDRKWIYIVTHFVKKGTVKPRAYLLTDGTWLGRGYRELTGHVNSRDVDEKAIFATAISKYVAKLGRLTIHPEVLLAAANFLPPRPGGWHTMSGSSTPETLELISSDGANVETTEWDWRKVEKENMRGLKFAENFAALEELQHDFSGSQKPALGRYPDLF